MKLSTEIYSIKKAAGMIGIPAKILNWQIDEGRLDALEHNGDLFLQEDTVMAIKRQKLELIGIATVMELLLPERTEPVLMKDVNAFREHLEKNDYFALDVTDSEFILFEKPKKNTVYFLLTDVPVLKQSCREFFDTYGETPSTVIKKTLSDPMADPDLVDTFRRIFRNIPSTTNITTTHSSVVRAVMNYHKPLYEATDAEITALLHSFELVGSRTFFVAYVNYLKLSRETAYMYLEDRRERATMKNNVSYTKGDLSLLNQLISDPECLQKQNVVQKALESSFYCEQWLYVSCHFLCAWRRNDITDKWIYLDLDKNTSLLPEVNRNTIYEDILMERYSREVYELAGRYVEQRIMMTNMLPGKTANRMPPKLIAALSSASVRIHIGRILLICEYHHLKDGSGRMKHNRVDNYTNRVGLVELFGPDIEKALGTQNFRTRRMNKAVLQAITSSALTLGYTPIEMHRIGSRARSHKNPESLKYYVSDGWFNGDSVQEIIYELMDRGAWSCLKTSAMKASLPKEWPLLSANTQSEIIKSLAVTSIDIEMLAPILSAAMKLQNSLSEANTEGLHNTLQALRTIFSGHNQGKYTGCGCLALALGKPCPYIEKDCIIDVCEYCIATSAIIPALYEVINNMSNEYKETGNEKIRTVYLKKVYPAFKDYINDLIGMLSDSQKAKVLLFSMERNRKDEGTNADQ